MLQTFLSYLILYGLQTNIVLSNGSGALEFQREKMYRSFRYLNMLILAFEICVIGFVYYFLETYLLKDNDLHFIGFTIVVFLSGVFNLIVSSIWQRSSNLKFYLYESSYSYAFDLVFVASSVFMLQMNVSILSFVMQMIAVIIVIMAMTAIIGFFVRSFNRGYQNVNFRNVSSRLFLLAFVSILIYYAELLIV